MRNRFSIVATGLVWAACAMAQSSNADKERQLQNALMSANPMTDIPIMMQINTIQLNRAEYRVTLKVTTPGAVFAPASQSGAGGAVIDFLGQVWDEYGTVVTNVRDRVNVTGSSGASGQKPLEYDTSFVLLPGTYRLKFVTRENATGRMGTYEQKYTVIRANGGQAAAPQQSVAQIQRFQPQQFRVVLDGDLGQGITGSPVSGREERKTVQTLGDGTQIETSDGDLFYRDSQGRTRIERTLNGKAAISVVDRVAGVRLEVDPAAKTATRIVMPALAGGGTRGGAQATQDVTYVLSDTISRGAGGAPGRGAAASQSKREDLGLALQNGVMAQGTRETVTIPQGQIGNSRDLHVVNERWYSKDLQMMVKTSNSDPRFGVTTYELTNISQTAPDPTLFQVPLGYAVIEQAGPAGRGGR
jgi:hypothetical protein